MPTFARKCAGLLLATLAVAACGCGTNLYRTATVTGTVKCDGKPASGGEIRFRPVDAPDQTGRPSGQPGRDSFATIREDGTFTLAMDTAANANQDSGALIGPNDVIFKLPRTKPVPIHPEDRERATPAELQQLRIQLDERFPVGEPLPCSAEITPQRVEVKRGKNFFEFQLMPK